MKIAIQGHVTRGKEVIQILKSLGGKNKERLNGSKEYWYFINSDGYIRNDYKSVLQYNGFKTYTLEEFEKEFPFKVWDKVIHSYTPNFIGTIVDIKFDDHIPYRVNIEGKICTCGTNSLKSYKEMQERNITLTLEKAKEWYKKGGELKEVALQAYSEEELTKIELPKTWEEFCENYPVQIEECWLGEGNKINQNLRVHNRRGKNWIPSKKSAEAHLAMIQLEQLRDCWWDGWKPDWSNNAKHVIKWEENDLIVFTCRRVHAFLVFPTEEMAKEFLECFKDLIKKAGDLI